jgi:hypothetical protein
VSNLSLAASLALLVVACAPPARPAAVGTPATSVVPAQLVPGATAPTRPPLTPAVAVSPLPTTESAPSPEASPAPAATTGPVLHPTLPRVDVTPTPAGR